jgi:hypothetical protein
LNLKEFAELEAQILRALKKPDQMDYSKLKLELPTNNGPGDNVSRNGLLIPGINTGDN